MTVRAVEGKKPYTGGQAITIDENKVISLNLRDENNLIIYDSGDDEIYVDLQLPDEITPTDAFPVGVTTGRVIVDNGWDANGTIICAKTTSGDNIKILYEDNGTLWIDNGTGTFKQIYFKGDVDAIVQTIYTYINENANVKAFLIYGTEAQKKQKLGEAINYYVVSGKIPLLNMDSVTYTLINAERGDEELGTDDVYTFSSDVNSDTGKYKEVKVNVYSTTPISSTVHSYTVTEHSAGGGSGDVVVSTDTGNELSTGVGLWLGTESDFSSISTPDTNTLYIQYKSDGGGGWQPGVNTLAYYEFDNNLNDSSGNNHNFSVQTGTVTYGTTVNGAKYGYFNTSTWTNQLQMSLTGDFTVLMRVNPQHDYGSTYPRTMLDVQTSNSGGFLRWYGTVVMETTLNAISTNNRHLLCVSYDHTNNRMYNYIDGVSTNDYQPSGTLGTQYIKINQVWNATNSSYTNDAYYSALIFEDKAWTATEIADYFNQTKGDYGIS